MTTIAPATCGFLPIHLYEGPDLDAALRIAHAINGFSLEAFGLATADPRPLDDLSLQQMLDAVRTVEAWNNRPATSGVPRSVSMVPDDRLTAAVYTLLHFPPRCADADDDSIPVRYRRRRWGDEEEVCFLLVGARPAREMADDEEEEAA